MVLVQFDGVLLHVWHMKDPFHRLLTSDVFRLPPSMGKRKRYIKLPNGGRIETDDFNALSTLQPDTCPVFFDSNRTCQYFRIIAAGGVLLLLAGASLIARHMLGN